MTSVQNETTSVVDRIQGFLVQLNLPVVYDAENTLFVINDEESGYSSLFVNYDAPLVTFEQFIMPVSFTNRESVFLRLLQMNRELVHGAFAIDESGERVIFRDTLQAENIDFNEFEGTLNALSLAMAENSAELISFTQQR